ncbi:hypothetical protein E8P82_08485 [Arthrobacter echini]|uniref:Uncharacterized protein n=1 Tax=Arthrobacter echini TaxID=1529066 RepID=A0A4S5E4R3_9MICC|nr:hypothetical protein [Arthrobacter echini]THJ66486.1 hypothetical protein E8P82_08485 [Arthrobacter echini]
MSHINETSGSTPQARRPVITWAFMVAALIIVLLLPDWAGTGNNRPIWIFALPPLLGIIGAGFAIRGEHPWWAVASALWGFFVIQAIIVGVTLIGGP